MFIPRITEKSAIYAGHDRATHYTKPDAKKPFAKPCLVERTDNLVLDVFRSLSCFISFITRKTHQFNKFIERHFCSRSPNNLQVKSHTVSDEIEKKISKISNQILADKTSYYALRSQFNSIYPCHITALKHLTNHMNYYGKDLLYDESNGHIIYARASLSNTHNYYKNQVHDIDVKISSVVKRIKSLEEDLEKERHLLKHVNNLTLDEKEALNYIFKHYKGEHSVEYIMKIGMREGFDETSKTTDPYAVDRRGLLVNIAKKLKGEGCH
jgi:hypothetical protein